MLPQPNNHAPQKIQALTATLLISFLAMALALFFWNVIRAPVILAREDNPRLAEAELRIQRGTITDRHNTLLARTVGPANRLDRIYPSAAAAGPAVGYYSFRHGTAGIEEGLDTILRGDTTDFGTNLLREALNQPQVGQNIQLTIDANWQKTADSLLPNQPSALLLLEITTTTIPIADIRAMVSHPRYDPNQLDDTFDTLSADEMAPLLNRVTQGQYQPGLLLQPFILAAAIDRIELQLTDPITGLNEPLTVESSVIRCVSPPSAPTNWLAALRHRCPAPMHLLGDQLGESELAQIFADFHFTQVPSLPLTIDPPPLTPIHDPLRASLGQENLTLSPLQIALALASLTNNGRIPMPRLVLAVQPPESTNWQPYPLPLSATDETAVSVNAATTIYQALPQIEGIYEHSVLVLSGPAGSTNAWYLGIAPATNPRYIIVVVIEDTKDLILAEKVGRDVITAVLE